MEVGYVREFVMVAEMLSYRQAARRLGTSASTLGNHIRSLETEVGVALLDRNQHRVTLTPAGHAFFDETRGLVEQLERAAGLAQRVATGITHRIRIGHVGGSGIGLLDPALTALCCETPNLQLSLVEARTNELAAQLVSGHLDIALINPPLHEPLIEEQYLCTEPLVAVLPVTHPITGRKHTRLADLADQTFVLHPRNLDPGMHDHIIHACERAGFRPNDTQEASGTNSLLFLVAAGAGVGLIPEGAFRHLNPCRIAAMPVDDLLPLPLHAAWRRDDTSPVTYDIRSILQRAANDLNRPGSGEATDYHQRAAAAEAAMDQNMQPPKLTGANDGPATSGLSISSRRAL